jgi:hypothetical protein
LIRTCQFIEEGDANGNAAQLDYPVKEFAAD